MAIPVTFVGDKYAKQSTGNNNQNRDLNKGANPRLVTQSEFASMQPLNTTTKVKIPNIIWLNAPIEAGIVFATSQGNRFVLEANTVRVLYILQNPRSPNNNKLFVQPTNGFMADVMYFPYEDAGRNLQVTKKIAEYEIQFIIGIFSVTSWTAFTIVLGTDVTEFLVKNNENLPRWKRIVVACAETRTTLKQYAPTLYNKLVYSTLLIAWEGTKFATDTGSASVHANNNAANTGRAAGHGVSKVAGSLADAAIQDPKIAGRGAGIIVGKIGLQAANGRITVLSVVWTVLFTVATKALSAIPGAVSTAVGSLKDSSLKEKAEVARQLLDIIKNSDIKITKEEAETIVSEVYAHPKELAKSLENLAKAFKDDK